MHKHVDHGTRLSVLLRASQPVEFHDTSRRTCYNANIALSAALVFQKH